MKSLLLAAFIFSATLANAQVDLPWVKNVGARKTPTSKKVYWVNDFGNIADSNAVISSIIQKAIDACAKKGGGVVQFKPGVYTTGAIYLKKGVHLKIDTVEDIHFRNITTDSVGNAFMYTMDWNPSYSYSKLPEGYTYETLPAHWKVMLTKVEPEEKGVPKFKDIYVSNIKVNHARKTINGSGLDRSSLENFHFENVDINAANAGEINFARDWTWKNVTIKTSDKSTVNVKNAIGLSL